MAALRNLKQVEQAAAANIEGFFLQGCGGVVVQDVEEVASTDAFPLFFFAVSWRDVAFFYGVYGKGEVA